MVWSYPLMVSLCFSLLVLREFDLWFYELLLSYILLLCTMVLSGLGDCLFNGASRVFLILLVVSLLDREQSVSFSTEFKLISDGELMTRSFFFFNEEVFLQPWNYRSCNCLIQDWFMFLDETMLCAYA
ncbi:hypothetical protein V6N12_058493 [Hibiscus sabdariffa]|uniref:Uncharacterized protein n=1 Tax=Hibiscus sabdariffa TaxID=183260 RepID=A0ABR2ESC5_9ROSI